MAPKQLHLIRHAQGYHNLNVENHQLRDPLLTSFGQKQCEKLATQFPNMDSVNVIVASPIKRTIYTALLTFKSLLESRPDLKVIALPELQETSDLPCDTGSPLSELEREFAGQPVDFSLLYDGWFDKTKPPFAPHADLIIARAKKARQFLQKLDADNVAAVTHGGFLHYLTEDWSGHEKFLGTGWANCEFRAYTFDLSTSESTENATINETKESRIRREGSEIPLTPAEQTNLREVALKSWGDAGYVSNGAEDAQKESLGDADSQVEQIKVKS